MKKVTKNIECLDCIHLKKKRIYQFLIVVLVIIFSVTATMVIAAKKNTKNHSLTEQLQGQVASLQTQLTSVQGTLETLLTKVTPATPATPGAGTKSIPESWCAGDVWCGEKYCTCSSGGCQVPIF